MKSYGVNKQSVNQSAIDFHMEEIAINGFSILENVLSAEDLNSSREKLDAVYRIQEDTFGKDNLFKIKEMNMVRSPLVYDSFFLEIATNSKILEIIKVILGDYFILHLQNGIINLPNEEHHQSSWHRDLPYQNFVISKPLSIGALFCIDDFSDTSGGTWVVPHSHRVEEIPSNEYIQKHAKQVIAKAGSVLLFDSMLFHRAGYNSANYIRRAINNVYTVPIIKQQINLPAALHGKYKEDPFLAKFLGYQSNTANSDTEWRQERLNR